MKKSTIFLGLTFLLSWPVAFVVLSEFESMSGPWRAMAAYFMYTPLISAIITQKFIFHQRVIVPLGISFRINRWFFVAVLLPIFLVIASTIVSASFPNVSLSLDPAETNIFADRGFGAEIKDFRYFVSERSIHPFFVVLISGALSGLTVSAVTAFGEELGWRGFLLRETAELGFWRSSWAIGFIWGLWHLPFIVYGINYPDHPIAGILMIIAWDILFSPLIAYVCIRSNSVIPAAIMHGTTNGVVYAPDFLLVGGDSLQIGIMGFSGMLVLLFLNLVLFRWGHSGEWHRKWMNRIPCNVNNSSQ